MGDLYSSGARRDPTPARNHGSPSAKMFYLPEDHLSDVADAICTPTGVSRLVAM